MKKLFFTIIVLLGGLTVLSAQTDYSKQIEVTREYTPTVERAHKLSITPSAADTVALQPDTNYSITPTPWSTPFSVGTLAHAQLSAARWRNPGLGYLRVGGGWPLSSEADVYITPLRSRSTNLGFYLNHEGFEDKLKNDMGVRADALSLENEAGMWLTSKLGEELDLEADAGYSLDLFTPYGGYSVGGKEMKWGERVRYGDAHFSLSLGHDFTEVSGLKYRFGGSLNLFSATDTNKNKFAQRDFSVWGRVAYGGMGHRVDLTVRAEGRKGADKLAKYNDFRLVMSPSYEFVTERNFMLRLGADLIFNETMGEQKRYVLPMVDVAFKRFYEFIPYAKIDGTLGDGSYRAQTLMNPYVEGGSWTKNSLRLGGRVGATGDIGGVVNYDVFGGYDIYGLYNYFVATDSSSRFKAVARPVKVAYYGANLSLHLGSSWALRGEVQVNNPKPKSSESASLSALYAGVGLRGLEGDVALHYNYKSKWAVALGARLLGEGCSVVNVGSVPSGGSGADQPIVTPMEDNYVEAKLPAATDLYLNVEYRPRSKFAVYLSGANLLNQKLYDFIHYPLPGVNVKAGVKVNF